MSTGAASTRAQHATGHINRILFELDADLAEIRGRIVAGQMDRTAAALWFRFLVESGWTNVEYYLTFAAREASS